MERTPTNDPDRRAPDGSSVPEAAEILGISLGHAFEWLAAVNSRAPSSSAAGPSVSGRSLSVRYAAAAKSRPRNTNGPTRGRRDNEQENRTNEDCTPAYRRNPRGPPDEPDVEAIVERCREVAAETGCSRIHDFVLDELERFDRKLAA